MMILELLTLSQIANPKPAPQPPEPVSIVETITKKKEPVTYKIKRGDTLTKIAKKYDTKWQRIYNKNKSIEHPDILEVGQRIVIPSKSEKLKKREYVQSESKSVSDSPKIARSNSPGNTYEPGQCVWYVKNRKPSIPNGWGSAYSWIANARASGWTVSNKPIAGAVGALGNHVVYVERVNGDEVTISEMNYNYVAFSKRTVTVPASKYTYIY